MPLDGAAIGGKVRALGWVEAISGYGMHQRINFGCLWCDFWCDLIWRDLARLFECTAA